MQSNFSNKLMYPSPNINLYRKPMILRVAVKTIADRSMFITDKKILNEKDFNF